MKSTKSIYILFLIIAVTACTPFGSLYKEQPRVTLALPVHKQAEQPKVAENDSTVQAPPLNFTFVSDKGDSIPVGMSVEWDSINKENLTTMALEEVVVAASSTRNTAERNGLVNVEFVVTIPKELQNENWMVNVRPVLMRGDVPDSLKELRFTGQRFREEQERDYRRYDRFLEKIIPDSVNFYRTYVDYRSFERYLERLKWYKRGLEKRWAVQRAKKLLPDPLLLRFDMFNRQVSRRDSLLAVHMRDYSRQMVVRQRWRYDRALQGMNDTLQFQNKYLLDRFRFFNNKWAGYTARQAAGMVGRKEFFRNEPFLFPKAGQPERNPYRMGGVDPRIYYPRFSYFNDKMERLDAALYRHYRIKGAQVEGKKGVKYLHALIAGRDTSSLSVDRSDLAKKYTRRYEKVRKLLPMFHFRRQDRDTLPPSWIAAAVPDTVSSRRKPPVEFSKEEIYGYYGLNEAPAGAVRSPLPLYGYRRDLPDSVQLRTPGRRAQRYFELSRFDSAATVVRYDRRYEQLKTVWPQYRFTRELVNINPPALRHAARQAKYGKQIERINSLDSTTLVKLFYNAQKIARNEARKASRDAKFRDIVRFPFNDQAHLDTVIYGASQVQFLYSQNVPADENSSRMKVFVVGSVLNSSGSEYPLPKSDTLTYLVSSMVKFVDKTPRFVQKILTRDAEANASVNFYFPKNRFRLDRSIEVNRQGVKQVHDLTLALMTDPVYIIDSLTLYATSSPEGTWRINGEMAQKRAVSIREILEKDFKVLYDSLAINATLSMDEAGNVTRQTVSDEIPDLPRLIKIQTIPEDWSKLRRLIVEDENFKGNKDAVLEIIAREAEPDRRERLIKSRCKQEYAYMLDKLYPAMRSVDFRFSLSRRGMQQDTVYTTEPDTAYARGVEYLEKRKYAQALEILRPYEDINTVIAYMSQGYDKAALRIIQNLPQTAENKYMQAVLQARLGDEEQAVRLLLSAADMNMQMKYRANLDPELSILVKKYGLFKDEDEW